MNVLKNTKNLSVADVRLISEEAGLPKWQGLYQIAGIAVIVMLALIPIQITVFTIWPTPQTVPEWFQLFQDNKLLGLMHLDLLYIVNNVILTVMYLALYMSMRQQGEALMLISLLTCLLGVAAYFASNSAFEMLSLSSRYPHAIDSEGITLLAAGEMLITQWKGTAFDVYYVLNAISLILLAVVMRKSPIYGKGTALIGLLSGILMLIPSTAGALGMIFSLASLVPWYIFSVLAARKFLQLSHIRKIAV
jgi:hypothetical protein